MKVEDLLVEVRDATYKRVGQILAENLVGFTVVTRFNQIGTWSVNLPVGHLMAEALKAPGAGIIVSVNGTVLLSGPTTWVQTVQTVDNPDGIYQITGLDDSVLLRDRLAYPTPSTADVTLQTTPYDVRTGLAEDVMKAYVNANMGPSAPAARRIPALTVQATAGLGSTVTGSARFDVLLDLLQTLADTSAVTGAASIGFDVVQVGTGLQFQCYAPKDRTATVRLDIANNRLTESTYSLSAPKFTRAIVGGSGDGAARTFLEQSSLTSVAAEYAWARRIESFVDARDTNDPVALATTGNSALATEGRAQITATVTPVDDQSMLFGTDWFLGDLVTVVVGTYELASTVTQLGISVQADGVRLYGTVGEPKTLDYEAQILAKQTDLASRINQLERYK